MMAMVLWLTGVATMLWHDDAEGIMLWNDDGEVIMLWEMM
jgi:hypothetical protein